MSSPSRQGFWREAFALHGSATLHVLSDVLLFGLIAGGFWGASWLLEKLFQVQLAVEVAPYEIAGAVLGLLLVFRTNAGYDRWWEARKLWGGIVNQSRNLVIGALSYGPSDAQWREQLVRWAAVFPQAACLSLRGERPSGKIADLVGPESANELATADHLPSFVARKLAELLREACDRLAMDRFAFLQLDRERALLIDHVGGCERILKTPVPLAYSIKIRQFILLFLLALPLALLHRVGQDWLVPIITMLVAYPLLALDQIGIELENPFSTRNLSHLPLDEIAATIKRNLTALLMARQAEAP
jgi:ion channel-forming bestrophin family protein